jgi:3-dehydroquinate synthase
MKTVLKITGSRSSPVFTGGAAFFDFNDFIAGFCERPSAVFVLVDTNTRHHCLPVLLSNVACLQYASILEVAAGEESKSLETAQDLWQELLRMNADRHSLMICLGGGVVTDLGGFVGATYKRGMPFIHIPTSLMGMVDAAVGGKTAVNLKKMKNQVGIFSLPEAVFIYPGFLKTLDRTEIRSGLAEVMKYGLALDQPLWNRLRGVNLDGLLLESFRNPFWEEVINRSVRMKISIVKKDFTETGPRKVLNFGHTAAHAIESLSFQEGGNPVPHGIAVAAGIVIESFLSSRVTGLAESDLEQITRWIAENFELPVIPDRDLDRLPELLQKDKKRSGDRLNFTLIESPGKAVPDQHCDGGLIEESFTYYRQQRPGG